MFPQDAIDRATFITKHVASIGAYSHSRGLLFIREEISNYIEHRDGFPSDPEHIFLTDGASEGIKRVLSCIITDKSSGILLPIPQYPLYSAAVTLLGGTVVPYYLDEERDWDLSIDELKRATNEASANGIEVKALCLINPGNPTGNHFTDDCLTQIAQFCCEERIVLLADEVYQANLYSDRAFTSMKRIVRSHKLAVELFSFHSTSKGLIGECGKRGGYFECTNIDRVVVDQLYKLASVSLCPNIDGQIMTSLMVAPPKENDTSYKTFVEEELAIKESLRRRASILTKALNQLPGIKCRPPVGAMYLFPSISLPKRFIDEAVQQGYPPDTLYCLRLLDETGICTVPGSGFGQQPGTYHLRMTFLPPEAYFDEFIEHMTKFHLKFIKAYNE